MWIFDACITLFLPRSVKMTRFHFQDAVVSSESIPFTRGFFIFAQQPDVVIDAPVQVLYDLVEVYRTGTLTYLEQGEFGGPDVDDAIAIYLWADMLNVLSPTQLRSFGNRIMQKASFDQYMEMTADPSFSVSYRIAPR